MNFQLLPEKIINREKCYSLRHPLRNLFPIIILRIHIHLSFSLTLPQVASFYKNGFHFVFLVEVNGLSVSAKNLIDNWNGTLVGTIRDGMLRDV